MNRSLKLSMLVALALGSSHAMALELGQIKVKSALGQPLLAEIPVTPEGPSDLRNLRAQLASDADFARAGITDGRTRVPLTFVVVNARGGGKMIRITSTAPINDPYLDLLVQVDNAAGKSVREYTILLDPPGEAAAPPAPAPAPARPASRPRKPAAAPAAAPAPATVPAESMVRDGKYGPVQSGQNLSSIAQKVLPAGADLNQMLLALKQANPDAFYRDNINALKSGAVLRVPTADETRATSVAAALAEVRRQNSDWRSGTVSSPTNVADSATRANASSSPSVPASDRDDHLALVPSSDKKGASAGSGKDGATVRRDLQRSQESLAALQQQGTELKSRLKDLEDINSKNERLLSLKDNEIAELQRKLAEARKGKPATAAADAMPAPAGTAGNAAAALAAKPDETKLAETSLVAPGSSTAAAPAAMPMASGTAAMPATALSAAKPVAAKPLPVKPKPKPVKPAHAAKPTVAAEPWYMQPWAWGAGVVVLLLVLLGVRGRRGKAAPKASGSSLADRFGSAPMVGELDEDGVDVDQEELLDQLAEHPDDIGLHLELVSLYYHRRDVEHFEAAAEAMYAHISDPQQSEWQDVAAMGEDLVPGHPLFVGVDTSVPESEREPLQGFNLDDYASDDVTEVVPVTPPPVPGPSKISEYHFDFNLTPRHDQGRPPLTADAEAFDASEEVGFTDDGTDTALPDIGDADEALPSWQDTSAAQEAYEPTEFSDDPIDTKLDLARAYLDMGDADGARAMLEEVLNEGSQPQRDTARTLLDGMV